MSWGTRIVILYAAFVAMIGTMVFMTMHQKVDLVSEDYYQQELKFQQQIDRQAESNSLSAPPQILAGKEAVTVTFPKEVSKSALSGKVNFYRPSDSSKDFQEAIAADSNGVLSIPGSKFVTGLYTVKLNWSAEGKNYYNEVSLYVP